MTAGLLKNIRQKIYFSLFSTFKPSMMTSWWRNYMVFCRVFFQFIPWTLLVGFYGTIFVKVHHQETQMAAYASKMKVIIKKIIL